MGGGNQTIHDDVLVNGDGIRSSQSAMRGGLALEEDQLSALRVEEVVPSNALLAFQLQWVSTKVVQAAPTFPTKSNSPLQPSRTCSAHVRAAIILQAAARSFIAGASLHRAKRMTRRLQRSARNRSARVDPHIAADIYRQLACFSLATFLSLCVSFFVRSFCFRSTTFPATEVIAADVVVAGSRLPSIARLRLRLLGSTTLKHAGITVLTAGMVIRVVLSSLTLHESSSAAIAQGLHLWELGDQTANYGILLGLLPAPPWLRLVFATATVIVLALLAANCASTAVDTPTAVWVCGPAIQMICACCSYWFCAMALLRSLQFERAGGDVRQLPDGRHTSDNPYGQRYIRAGVTGWRALAAFSRSLALQLLYHAHRQLRVRAVRLYHFSMKSQFVPLSLLRPFPLHFSTGALWTHSTQMVGSGVDGASDESGTRIICVTDPKATRSVLPPSERGPMSSLLETPDVLWPGFLASTTPVFTRWRFTITLLAIYLNAPRLGPSGTLNVDLTMARPTSTILGIAMAYVLAHKIFASRRRRQRILAELEVQRRKQLQDRPAKHLRSATVPLRSTPAAAEPAEMRKLAHNSLPQAMRPSDLMAELMRTPQGRHLIHRLLSREKETASTGRRKSRRGRGGASTASRASRLEMCSTLATISETEPFLEGGALSLEDYGTLENWGMEPSFSGSGDHPGDVEPARASAEGGRPAHQHVAPLHRAVARFDLRRNKEQGNLGSVQARGEFILDDMKNFTFDANGFLVPLEAPNP